MIGAAHTDRERAQKNTRIAAQPKLALERLKTITLPIPPRELQEQMVNEFDGLLAEVRRLESIQHQKLNALSELKQSLLQKAFSGELTAGKAASEAMRQLEEIA
ncbi:MAG: restriction endonuclease subunit S [Thiohalospira sp.]